MKDYDKPYPDERHNHDVPYGRGGDSDTNNYVFTLLRDIRETQMKQAESNGRIEACLESLGGPEGRVKKLETAQTRQWWVTVAIAPFLALGHAVAKKFGVDI